MAGSNYEGLSNKEIRHNNKQEIRKLEEMYITDKMNDLEKLVQVKKEEMIDKLQDYAQNYQLTEYTTKGVPYKKINTNPIVLQNYFFQTLNPLGNKEPKYSAEKLAIVWDLYSDMVAEINAKIGEFIPTITSFCRFAGITSKTFSRFRSSEDLDFRTVVDKIDDACFDINIIMAQKGEIKERTTMYRMNTEQEKLEKKQPEIHIHNESSLDLDMMQKRLEQIKEFNELKSKAIEVQKEDE